MQTENLTWNQAKNMLLTGVCKRVRYASSMYANSFEAINGKIYRRLDNTGILERGTPGYPDVRFCIEE